MAITSKEINLTQLSKELGDIGLIGDFNDLAKKVILPADGFEISDADLDKAIAKHVAVDDHAIYAAKKSALLEKLGITAEEATLLLG